MIPKRDKNSDIARDIAAGRELKEKIVNLAQEAASHFMKGESLNEAIADIAGREGFNRIQIQRLIEETNTVAYNKKYETVKKETDRRLSFELAELRKVLDIMGSSAPPEIDNPNEVKGRPGEGEILKEASTTSSLHRPHRNTEEIKEKQMAKVAHAKQKQLESETNQIVKNYQSHIFKIANSIVMSHKMYKNASDILSAVSDEVTLPNEVLEDIEKKAQEITEYMIENKRIHPNFSIVFEKGQSKQASYFLGEYSLINPSSETSKYQIPKIASTQHVSTFEQLLKIAKLINEDQEKLSVLYN